MSENKIIDDLVTCAEQWNDMGFEFERGATATAIKEIVKLEQQLAEAQQELDRYKAVHPVDVEKLRHRDIDEMRRVAQARGKLGWLHTDELIWLCDKAKLLEQRNQNMANAIIALSGCGSPDNITDGHLQRLFESLPDDACPVEGK